jgi:hypothetical protein
MVGAKSVGCSTCKRRKVKVRGSIKSSSRLCFTDKCVTSVMRGSQSAKIASEQSATALVRSLDLSASSNPALRNIREEMRS